MRRALLGGLSAVVLSCASVGPAAEAAVDFNRDIRPILSHNCFQCHGPDAENRKADLRLDLESEAYQPRGDAAALAPGDLDGSLVWRRITSDDEYMRMPPADSNKELTAEQIALIGRWIEQGAKYQGHWAFIPPEKPPLPDVRRKDWPHNAIDRFVLARLEKEGLEPSPEADRATLIRRVTFDLTGLPPTLEEIDAFVGDSSPNAYEKVVDRLLASPHYGERMTLAWMDAARYGDTSVFHADGNRYMWGWRDWVIRAYNANMPFDRFTIEQLAGDLLPNATVARQVATGFNRNHGTSDEGGAIAEEYRVKYVVDRVKTTSMVWLGLTMECAQCHDHKYDPISQEEYYRFYAYFNQTSDPGLQTRNGNQAPLVEVPKPGAVEKIAELQQQVAAREEQLKARKQTVEPQFQTWVKETAANLNGAKLLPSGALVHCPLDKPASGERKPPGPPEPDRPFKIHGKVEWADGKLLGALKFDGGTYVDLGDVANFERTDKFSYGAWIYSAAGSGAPLARMDDGRGHRGYDLYLMGGRVAVHLIHHWPDNAVKVVTKKPMSPGAWHHVFVTYDGSSKAAGIKIYIDGKERPWSIEQDRLSKTIRSQVPLYLGRRNPGSPFKGRIDDARVYARQLSAEEVAALAGADPIRPLLALPADERTPDQVETLRTFYLANHDAKAKEISAAMSELKGEIARWSKPLTTVMVMREMPNPRKTYVLKRGHYASPIKDEVMEPGVPAVLPPLPKDAPPNRLALARWLVRPDHPLTSRVTVNRYWTMLFGRGIVATPADFGSQGEWPTHPRLLDWLATDFIAHGWNVKRTIKQIVMSAAYRQSSKLTPELKVKDPQNKLLARGPRFRLQGEFIRDQALAVGGLLTDRVGGPSVKPYQPPGLWREVSLDGRAFVQDHGAKLYRRSMYTFWKRSAPAPAMRIFDAPSREKCVIQRQRTNTPLQALVTLNDPQFVEAARALAARMLREGGGSPDARIAFAMRLATARPPRPEAAEVLRAAYERELAVFRAEPERAKALLAIGESPRDKQLDPAQHAAWTVVASMILNLDRTLIRQ